MRKAADVGAGRRPILRPNDTCWRIARAGKAALLIDSAAYFHVVREVVPRARRSVLLLGWNFDPTTTLVPGDTGEAPNTIGGLLNAVAAGPSKPDVRVLIWDMALPLSARNRFFPRRAARWFRDSGVKFKLDSCAYAGACHHQKILVIDDELAFCGGGDFAPERWDTTAHRDDEPRRRLPSGKKYPPRHEVMMMASGPVAAALGDLVRSRWQCATGDTVEAPAGPGGRGLWPEEIAAALTDVPVAIARTEAPVEDRDPVRENENLYLAAIAAARKTILIENQYFTAPAIGAALAARLAEPNGPEIVVICTEHSPGFLDGLCMDAARDRLLARLKSLDRHGRFHAYGPHTAEGRAIIVHSKVMIVDDAFLRVGSCNVANRSMGFDTECDLAFEDQARGGTGRHRQAVAHFRNSLLGHYLGLGPEDVAAATEAGGSLREAIERLDNVDARRLPPLRPRRLGALGKLIARYHLGDPEGPADAWRPWRRGSFSETFERLLESRTSATRGK